VVNQETRKAVLDLLERLPRTSTMEDLQYRLYVLQSVERGQREIACGRAIPHSVVARTLRKKWRGRVGR